MTTLVFPGSKFEHVAGKLLSYTDEACAVLLCNSLRTDSGYRLLVRDSVFPSSRDYRKQSRISAQLTPEFLVSVLNAAKATEKSMVFVHTHPFTNDTPEFSSVDDAGESEIATFLRKRLPHVPHAAMVIAPNGCSARLLGTQEPMKVVEIGSDVRQRSPFISLSDNQPSMVYDRQLRAFGKRGQQKIEELNIGIVGAGGTGSVVVEQLAHLGAKRFTIVDPDTVEESNLNRLIGAKLSDVGAKKTEVAATMIRQIQPLAEVRSIEDSILRIDVAKQLANVDFLFCCTDSHGSRAIVNQLAYQYLIPTIDLGVTIDAPRSVVSRVYGRVQMLAPGLGCLICGGILNAEEIRRDLLSDFERKADPYIMGAHEPQPAVISLNATVASLAVTMFLAAVAGIPSQARFQLYNAIAGNIRTVVSPPNPVCVVCSQNGALGRGDEWPIPGRAA